MDIFHSPDQSVTLAKETVSLEWKRRRWARPARLFILHLVLQLVEQTVSGLFKDAAKTIGFLDNEKIEFLAVPFASPVREDGSQHCRLVDAADTGSRFPLIPNDSSHRKRSDLFDLSPHSPVVD